MNVEFAVALLWGGGTLGAFAHALLDDIREWHLHRDARARRNLLDGFALFLAAIASGAALVTVLLTSPDLDTSMLRRLLSGIAWGAFGAAGIIRATARGPR